MAGWFTECGDVGIGVDVGVVVDAGADAGGGSITGTVGAVVCICCTTIYGFWNSQDEIDGVRGKFVFSVSGMVLEVRVFDSCSAVLWGFGWDDSVIEKKKKNQKKIRK